MIKLKKLNYDGDLSLNNYYVDNLSFLKTDNFEPKYNYFKPDENTLEIRLEIPGNASCDIIHNVIGDETIITIKGNKRKDNYPKEPNFNIFNSREFSDYEVNIHLKVEEFKITESMPKEGYPKFINGICIIQYELAKKGEKQSASANIEDEF